MEIDSYLNSDEFILKTLHPKKNIPLRLEDWVKMPFFTLFCIVLLIIFRPLESDTLQKHQLYKYLITPMVIFLGIAMTIGKLYFRRLRTINSTYYITNKRIIIFNKSFGDTIKSFFFNNFPEIEYRENAYGFGYIIIGKKEPLANRGYKSVGINPLEHKNVMNNIVNVKTEYDFINSLILNTNEHNNK